MKLGRLTGPHTMGYYGNSSLNCLWIKYKGRIGEIKLCGCKDTTTLETTMIPAENYNNLVQVMEEMVNKLKVTISICQ